MDDGYNEYLNGNPHPPDQRTPPNLRPPQEEGGGAHSPGGAQDVTTAAAAAGTAFEVNVLWRMPRHPTYEHPLCRFMAFNLFTINHLNAIPKAPPSARSSFYRSSRSMSTTGWGS